MISYILLIISNVLAFFYLKKKINTDNPYTKERYLFNKIRIKYIFRIINISNIVIGLIFYLINYINNYELGYLNILLYVISIFSYIVIELFIKKSDKRFKLIDKKIIGSREYLIIYTATVILLSSHITSKYDNIDIFIYIPMSLIILLSLWLILRLLKQNKNRVCYKVKEDEYLEDIKFSNKVELCKTSNYFIYIFAFIIFVYIRLPYIFILYILVILALIYTVYKKAKKVENVSNKIYKSITIANTFPGIIFAFQFMRDILLLKKLLILLIGFTISILTLYGLGESAFLFVAVEFYILLLYEIVSDKIYLIKYTNSLNEDFINKKVYTINQVKPISYIDTIKVFNIKLYKFIIVDNIIYESNILLYDPELVLRELNIMINKSNLEDYIVIESMLYKE